MAAQALNCPNCGAAVSSDSSLCQFCKSRLKTVGCPKCLGLMFVGSKFCEHCGAIAAPVNVELEEKVGDCPRCRSPLEAMQIGETHLRGCGECDGMWMTNAVFEETCADAEKRSAVLGYFRERLSHALPPTKISYVPCPDCGELMNRNNFAKASGVIVDVCKQHGVWFDADELPAIVEFVQKGGMEIARQRQLNEIKDERERLRADRHDPFAATIHDSTSPDVALNIRSFVKTLFG
ncbi:MAG TPA: zf-TFIIB domain-containing protein [Pyrinomonadaceae bacterium]|nr:zf-TFIIB domain-containing protein [Pyrinomonadaceae bacterium]